MEAINEFTDKLREMIHAYIKEHYPGNLENQPHNYEVKAEQGRKYVKIFSGMSVYCFIDKLTGDIWKPKDWRGPIKNVKRGNIHDENPLAWCGPHGRASAK